jgi:hypothetical protein
VRRGSTPVCRVRGAGPGHLPRRTIHPVRAWPGTRDGRIADVRDGCVKNIDARFCPTGQTRMPAATTITGKPQSHMHRPEGGRAEWLPRGWDPDRARPLRESRGLQVPPSPTPPGTGRLAGRPNKTCPERPTNEEGAAPIPHPIRNRAVEFFGLLCSPSDPKARAKRESTEQRGGAAERLTRLPA